MKKTQTTTTKRTPRRANLIEGLDGDAYGALVEAALEAKKIATLQHAVRLLEEVKSMLSLGGFQPGQPIPMGGQHVVAPPPPPVPVNPCVECGRIGIWQAPSTQQWFCQFHEALGKTRYADDRTTKTSPSLRVVQTPATAQHPVVQPPAAPPPMVEIVEAAAPVLQEQPAGPDALREEMNRLMNGGAV